MLPAFLFFDIHVGGIQTLYVEFKIIETDSSAQQCNAMV